MNRFIALLMLTSFVVRQFDCCSDQCQASSCRELRPTAMSPADDGASRCSCRHHQSDPANTKIAKACLADDVDKTPHHSHQHHLCVANHLVYTSTQRVATKTLQSGIAIATVDVPFESNLRARGKNSGIDAAPPRLKSLQRAQLGVYRI